MDGKDPGGIACRTDRAFGTAHFALVRTRTRLCMTETSALSFWLSFGIGLASLLSKAWQTFNPWHLELLDIKIDWKMNVDNLFWLIWLTCMSMSSTAFHSLFVSARSRVMLLFLINWTCLALDWYDIHCWARCRSCLWMHTCLWLDVAHILVSLNAFTYTSCIAFIA